MNYHKDGDALYKGLSYKIYLTKSEISLNSASSDWAKGIIALGLASLSFICQAFVSKIYSRLIYMGSTVTPFLHGNKLNDCQWPCHP